LDNLPICGKLPTLQCGARPGYHQAWIWGNIFAIEDIPCLPR
jgi:hypothetical protein